MKNWLSNSLIKEVKEVFNPKYGYQLTDEEACEIAASLVNSIEAILSTTKTKSKK